MKITKFNHKGMGVGEDEEGNSIKLWNAIPGDEVEYSIYKKRKREGFATEIIKESEDRIFPEEDAFLSTSPWQILSRKAENKYKLEILNELFENLNIKTKEFVESENYYGYRNKMEFSLYIEQTTYSLAFHKRLTRKGLIPVKGSKLAEPVLNRTAKYILDWLNLHLIAKEDVKTIIVKSNGKQAIGALFIKTETEFERDIELTDELIGFKVYYSNPLSPASVPTKTMQSFGQDYLEDKIGGIKLKHGLNSFFQVNVPVFEQALNEISNFIDKEDEIIDFYSGVGSISLPLHKNFKFATLVEINEEATEYARQNVTQNNIKNCDIVLSASEKATEYIKSDKVLILDPPREGLHKNVIKAINEKLPKRIIYLSCNPKTQAEDLEQIIKNYEIKHNKAFNFFPRTPHIENLVILDLKI